MRKMLKILYFALWVIKSEKQAENENSFSLSLPSLLPKGDGQGEDTRIPMTRGKLQNKQYWRFVLHSLCLSHLLPLFSFLAFTSNAVLLLNYYTRTTFSTPQI